MKIWQPSIKTKIGNSQEMPMLFKQAYNPSCGFKTKEECDEWIDKHIFDFDINEIDGTIYPKCVEVETPTLMNSDGYVLN